MGLLLAVSTGCLVLLGALWAGQRQLIYFPDPDVADPPPEVGVREVESDDGIVHQVWLVPAEGDAFARVLVFNGNAGNKSHRLPLAQVLAEQGMEVVLFDYRGYGDTAGTPSESGLLSDARAVAELAFAGGLPVVYLGESIGSGVATALAEERQPAALVLRSPFTSLAGVASVHYPLVPAGILLRDRFAVEEAIARLEVPVLVVLGTADAVVPPELSRRVFEAATGDKELMELNGVGHNDRELTSGPELARTVRSFLEARS